MHRTYIQYIRINAHHEYYFWGKLKSDHKGDFSGLIGHSNFNCYRKHRHLFIEQVNQCLADTPNESENVYLANSIPILVCQIAREKRNI